MPRRSRPREPMLYDPRFEHDACGIGFVADAGGISRDRVLPLALAGLSALGHRGAFAADGESSDGAGMSLPLETAFRARIGADASAGAGDRPAVLQLFMPAARAAGARARLLVERALATEGLEVARWRRVPADPSALGREAAAGRPGFDQAIVAATSSGPSGPAEGSGSEHSRTVAKATGFEVRLLRARRAIETAAREQGVADLAVVSASARTIVYKGLVAGSRLSALFPDLEPGLDGLGTSYALFHQRYATNTRPVWRLAQPFRLLAHNGEINTVRGNREQVRGRASDPDPRGLAAGLLAAGPLLAPDGSDSLSLDEAIELLVASGWDLPVALLAAIPEAVALRRSPHAPVTA
ncbi:MAG TPA: hypothetical protein VK656_02170, partial [Candidatus Acidoferrum sp.]|nr:hypothetical protein [Candidatus Acidoferrum sp.]